MNRAVVIRFAVSAALLGTVAVGCKPASHPATLSGQSPRADRQAAQAARHAAAALARNDAAGAVRLAEDAVALAPRTAAYRILLGRAYIAGGRFASAETVLADGLVLAPGDGQAELSLALTRIALGKWDDARTLLAAAKGKVGESDRGLALALAGDKPGGVAVLEAAARATGADAKARQNLALGYALSGRWAEAASIAAQDLPPAQLKARMTEWAHLSQPKDAWDQVAALLHVTPVEDAGLPTALALAAPPSEATAPSAMAIAEPILPADPAPAQVAAIAMVEERTAITPPPAAAPVLVETAAATPPNLIAAPRFSTQLVKPVAAIAPTPQVAAGGRYVVQLGAFANAGSVEGAWHRMVRRVNEVARFAPSSATFATERRGTVYRLSVAGFQTRESAAGLCRQVRSARGECFVRETAGDALAAWARPGIRLASR